MIGTFRVFFNGKDVPPDAWKRRKALDILAYLISQRGRGVPRERLIDLYWPESDADGAHDSLRVTITAIRKVIGDAIKYEANTYRLTAPPNAIIDVDVFDTHLERARQADAQGDHAEARLSYQAAVNLYRGDFLEGMQEGGWQWRERERLRAACIEALRWLANDRGAASDAAGQRLVVERLLEVAPFDLTAVKTRLDALSSEMRVSEARRDYQEWRARYKAAVGAEAPDIWHAPEMKPVDMPIPAST
jgi:DNA-binding SARP family transcriptional activator